MRRLNVALAGNPNSGKTTLFNLLAGTNYHVANYPGITVERRYTTLRLEDQEITLHDLPGTYSLTAYSIEEKIARDFIINEQPDLIVQVVDAASLTRSLYLTVQLLELGVPVIVALNMLDVVKKRNKKIDADLLSERFKLPVVSTIARSGKGKEELLAALGQYQFGAERLRISDFSYGKDIDDFLLRVLGEFGAGSESDQAALRWRALKYLEKDEEILSRFKDSPLHGLISKEAVILERHTRDTLNTYPEGIIADYRYGIVKNLSSGVVKEFKEDRRRYLSDTIDSVVTQRLLGPALLFGVLYLIYNITFYASEYPVAWLETFFELLAGLAESIIPEGLFRSLIVSGIIGGVGGVLGFTPLIFFMFFVIAFMEDSGYMARMAYILDRIFRFFNLQGSSVVPFIVSGGIAGGCAVPGIMAARTIKGHRERLLTILTAPFMACGAKLPVFALLVAAFFPGDKGLMMLAIVCLSWCFALAVAKIFSKTIVKGEHASFIMELPPYRVPTLKGMLLHAWERTWMYIKKAGTVILGFSIVLWALMTFPELPESRIASFQGEISALQAKYEEAVSKEHENLSGEIELTDTASALKNKILQVENRKAKASLQNSIAGRVGTALEPVTKFAGFDWRINIALIGGFAAKEVVVSTLGTAYSLGDVDLEETGTLSDKLKNDPAWSPAVALALILFTILYAPCFATVVTIARETAGYKWAVFSMIFNTLLAFSVSALAYQLLS